MKQKTMKSLQKTLILFIVTTFLYCTYAQTTDSVYYERLYYTCKVWGHAKYYHSRIAAGYVDWDDILLNALPGIKNATDNQSFNDSLLLMLQQAGETKVGNEPLPEVPDSLNNNTDLSWFYHPIFSSEVSALLDTIMKRFTPKPNKYVGVFAAGNPNFQNYDNKYYSGTQYPDECKRILAVFRYWNIIHYFFPYKNIMDQDWDTTLKQTIPDIVKAVNATEYHLAMRVLTSQINDSHSFFNSQTYNFWKGEAYTPFLARFIEEKIIITKVHQSVSDQIFTGDIIKKIDNFYIDVLRDSLRKYSYGSNEISIDNNLLDIVLSGIAGQFSITILNEKGEKSLNLNRGFFNLTQDNTPYWREVTHNGCRFGIVHMGNLRNYHFPKIIDNFNNMQAIIFDIRNYPNATLPLLVNCFFKTPIHIANFTTPNKNFAGSFFWKEGWIGEGNSNPLQKKIILLFDERTLSQAEYTCMGLEQIPGAIKIGSTTAAADGNTSCIELPGQIQTYATFLGTFYPDNTPTQRIGIIPDYYVYPTIQGIREGRDEVLEFALNCDFVGIKEFSKKVDIPVYPNPTNGELTIDNGQWIMNNEQLIMNNIEVFDVYGRKQNVEFHSYGLTILRSFGLSSLPAGVYFVRILTEDEMVIKKIIKY